MPLLVDFVCTGCGTRQEHWTPSPPPAAMACPTCGRSARRVWSPIRLGRGASQDAASTKASPAEPSLCQQYPQLPGLCHMTPSAQRRVVATYRKDGRALDQELGHQEEAARLRPPALSDAISHHHQPPVI